MNVWRTATEPRLRRLRDCGPLGFQEAHDVTLPPTGRAHVPLRGAGSGGIGMLVGGYDAQGRAVPALSLQRDEEVAAPPTRCPAEEDWEEECVYGGVLWGHFGHFLLEGLSRAWGLPERPGLPVVWHATSGQTAMTRWQCEILDILGLGEREHRIVVRPVRIARLWVPDQGFMLRRYFHPAHAAMLGAYSFAPPSAGRRVWLSRSALPDRLAAIRGEREVEALLAAQGWTILHPERHGVREQLRAMEAAEMIAGFEGSAFHTLVLARDIAARVAIVGRGRNPLHAYAMIGLVKGIDQFGLRVPTHAIEANSRQPSCGLDDPADVVARLGEVLAAPALQAA